MRVCTKCHTAKPSEAYYKCNRVADGCMSRCKNCFNTDAKERRRKNIEKYKQKSKSYYLNNKPKIDEKRRIKLEAKRIAEGKPSRKILTKEESLLNLKAYQKAYREANKEKSREYKRLYQIKNREAIAEKKRKYIQENAERRKEYLQNYLPRRRKLRELRSDFDPFYRLVTNLRGRITTAFKLKQGWGKRGTSQQILGADYHTVKAHLESQFHFDMDWDNYGATSDCWCIDHRIPLSSAKTEEEVRKLCHYTNLQPLWVPDNLSKNNKMP